MRGDWLSVPLLALTLSCGEDPANDQPCRQAPTFRVIVSASPGPLPPDTVLHVETQFVDEDYFVYHPTPSDLIFCDPKDASPDVPIAEVHCNLWTQAPADVTVEAGGCGTLEQALKVKRENDCIATRDVSLVLVPGDGG